MTQQRGANIAASVRQRLLNKSRETDRPFNELLQYFAMERFLYRLSQSEHAEKFILKGALMFIAWQAPVTRPTMDIDLLGITDNSIDVIVALMKDVCLQAVEPDGLIFDAGSISAERIVEDADYAGVRVMFRGALATARIAMQVDIGFGDSIVPDPEMTDYPTILELPAPRIKGYSRESAIAEKFEAMVKLGIINSRVKDFFDIWLLSRQFDFAGQTMAQAVKETFITRGTTISANPVALSADFASEPARQIQWQGFVRRNRLQKVPDNFIDIVEAIASFLNPLCHALVTGQSFENIWKAPGPWLEGEGNVS